MVDVYRDGKGGDWTSISTWLALRNDNNKICYGEHWREFGSLLSADHQPGSAYAAAESGG